MDVCGVINSDTYYHLSVSERMQAQAIAEALTSRVGGYRGSPGDAITDACTIMQAARFAPPMGDNHHNALLCPYCTPGDAA